MDLPSFYLVDVPGLGYAEATDGTQVRSVHSTYIYAHLHFFAFLDKISYIIITINSSYYPLFFSIEFSILPLF